MMEEQRARARPDIPNANRGVAATSAKDVKCGMEGARVDCTKVAVVMTHDLVGLEVPALDQLVLTHSEHIGVTVADSCRHSLK